MARPITVEQFAQRLPGAIRLITNKVPGFLLVAGKRLEGEMKKRIFNRGEASDGSKIGSYSNSYAALRQRRGRQTGFVDLQFTGNLFSNVQTVKDGADVAIAIPNDKDFLKATDNEKRFEKTIFEPTEQEEISVDKEFTRLIENEVERIIDNL